MTRKLVEVAAAVIEQEDGRFLLGRRPQGTVYAGWWEFPGGKVEVGETPHDALVRELREELGIDVARAVPWITREHEYEHAHVRLHFFRVTDWSGQVRDLQHDALSWERADVISVAPVLPANAPVFAGLRLPLSYGITHASAVGVATQLKQLETALVRGLRLVQIRESALPPAARVEFAAAAVRLCRDYGALSLINSDVELARQVRANGVHFSAAQLLAQHERPGFEIVGASCHNAAELEQAKQLGLDFVAVGTVLPTASHPGQAELGWEGFAQLIDNYALPVYALGGLSMQDLETARAHGAHGIAGIRGIWAE